MIPFSDEELKPVVEQSLEKVAPMLALDGGGLELLAIKNGKVFVRLQGACVGCSASGQTVKYGIERQLRMDIHPEIEVVNIAPGMEHMIDEIANS
jgi:Fe-S cluster biogenesis protein NfuA